MKKKLFTLLAALMCGTLASFAQPEAGTFSITPKVGVNISTLTGRPRISVVTTYYPIHQQNTGQPFYFPISFSEKACRFGWRAGVEMSYQLSRRFALAAELKYSLQGTNYESLDIPADADLTNYKIDRTLVNNISLTQHHIQLPILARYYVLRGLAIEAGLQPSYCASSRLNYDITVGDKAESIGTSDFDTMSKFDLSLPVGISYEIKGIVVDARYNIGLTNAFRNSWDAGSTPSSRNSVIEISVGYRFGL